MDDRQRERIGSGQGFFAALDQSGGSTPKALAEYGIDKSRYDTEAEMFDLVHEMRTRIITNPAFDGSRILGAILFEQTMERDMLGIPTARYLWEQKQVVPFLKVDKGLADERDGVQLMKPIDTLDRLLERAIHHRVRIELVGRLAAMANGAAITGYTRYSCHSERTCPTTASDRPSSTVPTTMYRRGSPRSTARPMAAEVRPLTVK